ncbi:5-methylcytosine rRNA methyltransferase NSUN4-like isoform X2 [Haliotis rufescens]|uniref:5-methylcytosine rRNA methyltransferase NSUN4-like isoform X2 n=1 Tax=Haliotis rufescens TaxID=6454 RepID=UPI001EB04AC5|nr:5-methylcytosine rRNA methyltransferase NSUN4-like isoform X2 [Haliotis rufescens]XP_048239945.1 5-methylcytosine rRNA methyltransferase NSUN4-like isoform X2 [Haliotis rufescens]
MKATKLKEKAHTSLALEHFDTFYKPMYGEMWPSIRVALLSQQKYCALVNNYSDHEKSCSRLAGLGARNIINTAHHTGVNKLSQTNKPETDEFQGSWREPVLEDEHWNLQDRDATKAIFENVSFQTSECDISSRELKHTEDDLIDPLSLNPDTNLSEFMPVDKVYSEKEVLKMAEVQQSMFEPRDIQVSTVTPTPTVLPQELRVYAFNKGDVSAFPAPKLDSTNVMGYYLLDASSILPVIALDLQSHDSVLDLCAAPGGKTLAMLQLVSADYMTCNDASAARLRRLKDMLRWYYPHHANIDMLQRDGRQMQDSLYSKVLVDAPCNTDRHVVLEDKNNLFKHTRVSERLELPRRQKDLLIAGIKCCKPGGSVVYSTCTLSPAQNDGVIQSVVEEIWQQTDIDIVIQDLSWIASKFRNTFRFYSNCRHGQLVLPCLTANFGPMYFSKIIRIK